MTNQSKDNETVIAILGMHRSGTSCLTGMLEDAGLYLGNVMRSNPYQPKGNNENPKILSLNEKILGVNESNWQNPPNKIKWGIQETKERDAIIEEYRDIQLPWAFKDPRLIFTFDFWHEALPNLKVIGIYRDPISVAYSLQPRKLGRPLSLEQYIELWGKYNNQLIKIHTKLAFDILSLDVSKGQFAQDVKRTLSKIGIYAEKTSFEFYDESAIKSSQRKESSNKEIMLPKDIQDLYNQLNRIYHAGTSLN